MKEGKRGFQFKRCCKNKKGKTGNTYLKGFGSIVKLIILYTCEYL